MNCRFTYELTPEEQKEWESFFNSLSIATIEQLPSWTSVSIKHGKYCYFIGRKNENLVCCSIIAERKSGFIRYADIQFGPLFISPDDLIESINEIVRHYQSLNYAYLSLQLAIPSGSDSDYIEHSINKKLRPLTYFNRDNWSSIALSLEASEEELFRNLSKGHKSDIKKALKNNITVSDGDDSDLEEFSDIFVRMNNDRGIQQQESETRAFLKSAYQFVSDHKRGLFLVVKNQERKNIGGVFVVFQGNTARYFKGASDSSFRHLPVLHLAIWEAIKRSRDLGYKIFDFWGYNHYVDENDQVFFINRFKKGFGGSYLFYPKKMFFIYKPLTHSIYKVTRQLYQRFLKRN